MKFKVSSRTCLLTSLERSLSPYNKSCTRTLFERVLIWTNGCNTSDTPARRSRRWMLNEGQCSKKCSVSSIPSFVGHIGFMVSLKLCLNLWKFNLLRPTLIWERYDKPNGSWIPKTGFAGGRIIDKSFDLKAAMDGVILISGSSLFHSDMQLG